MTREEKRTAVAALKLAQDQLQFADNPENAAFLAAVVSLRQKLAESLVKKWNAAPAVTGTFKGVR